MGRYKNPAEKKKKKKNQKQAEKPGISKSIYNSQSLTYSEPMSVQSTSISIPGYEGIMDILPPESSLPIKKNPTPEKKVVFLPEDLLKDEELSVIKESLPENYSDASNRAYSFPPFGVVIILLLGLMIFFYMLF